MFIDTIKVNLRNGVCSGNSAAGKNDDCYSEGRGFETLSGSLLFGRHESFLSASFRLLFESSFCDAQSVYIPVCVRKKNANPIY